MAKVDRLTSYISDDPILWADRKRILGMPISFTRYSFDENKFYTKVGLLSITNNELLLYRVLDLQLNRSFWQRIFKVGTITMNTADQTNKTLVVKNIKDSERVFKALSTIVEKERDEKRVLGKEMFGTANMGDGCDCGDLHHVDSIL